MLLNRSLFPILRRIILPVFSLFIISSHGLNAQVDTCVHIDFETVNGEIGDTVCVKVKVSNFKDILSFQFPINYDPRVVIPLPATIDSIANIVGFDASGIVPDFTRAAIRVVYANPNNDTVNLPDGSVLFIICFKLIGAPGDCSKITFSDRPISAEFVKRYPVDNDLPVCIIEDNPKDEICINVPDSLTVLNYTCGSFTNTGKITIKAWGGRGPYTVTCPSTIPPTNSTINKAGDCLIIGGQMAGVYNFKVVDALGKVTIFNVTVNASSSIKIIQDNNYSIDPTCWYSSNGRLGITFNGGSGTPFVKWLPINAFGLNRLSGLMKGKYTVVVTDTSGCSESLDLELRADSLIGQLTIDKSATCKGFCDGKATIRASGGTPCLGRNYEFVWSGPQRLDCPRDTVCRNDSLCGNQFVVIRDCNKCEDTIYFNIPNQSEITTLITVDNVKCIGQPTGRIMAEAKSSDRLKLPITFDLRDVTNTTIAGGITVGALYTSSFIIAGTYYLRTIDSIGCERLDTIKVFEPSQLDLLENQIDTSESCSPGNDATLDVRGVGGVGPYQYDWSNMVKSNRITNLSKGTYTVTITDANQCSITKTYSISKPLGPNITGFNNKNINCLGDTSGCVEVLFTQGSSNVTFTWNVPGNTSRICSLGAGTYTVTLTDQSGCTDTATTKIITANNPIVIDSVVIVQPSCPGKSDGFIIVFAKGGSGLLTYAWNNNVNTQVNSSLKAGRYVITVDDIGGCSGVSDTFDLIDRPKPLVNVFPILGISCTETASCDASMYATVATTDSIVVFTWSSGEQKRTISKSGMFRDSSKLICSGRQYVIVTVNDLCSDTSFFDIAVPPKISLDSSRLTLIKPSCFGTSDGSITIAAKDGCTPYIYNWVNPISVGPSISNLKDGYYKVKITDCRGCVHFDSIRLRQPDTIRVQIIPGSTYDVSCPGKKDGRITLVWNGGAGGKGRFNWSPINSKDSLLTDLSAGIYSVTVTDNNNCTGETSVTIQEPPPLSFIMSPLDTPKCTEDQIDFSVEQILGGLGPLYRFTVDDGAPNAVGDIVPLFSGSYKITVYDRNGCTIDTIINIPNPLNDLSIEFGQDEDTIQLGDSIRLIGVINSQAPINTYLWDPISYVSTPNSNDSYVRPGQTTVFMLTVTDENGCIASDKINIIVESVRHFYGPNVISANGDQVNDFLDFYAGPDVLQVDLVEVFDRWGGRIYSIEKPTINGNTVRTWNGQAKGDFVMPGVYVYLAKVTFRDGSIVVYRGDITVVR